MTLLLPMTDRAVPLGVVGSLVRRLVVDDVRRKQKKDMSGLDDQPPCAERG